MICRIQILHADNSPNWTPPDIEWSATFGGSSSDVGKSALSTTDNGYVFTGYTRSFGAGNDDLWILKTNADGVKLWDRTYGGETASEYGNAIISLEDNGLAVAGYTGSYGAGQYDYWLVRTDLYGIPLFKRTFGDHGNDYSFDLVATPDRGFALIGYTNSFGPGDNDIWLVKTDSLGNEIWSETYGGESHDEGYSIIQTSDGNFVFTGSTRSFGSGGADLWMVCTDSLGNEIWSRTYGGESIEYGFDLLETDNHDFLLTGYTMSYGAGASDVWVIRTDLLGNEIWNRTFGGSNHDYGYSAHQTGDGGFCIAGYTRSSGTGNDDVWLIRIDESGNVIWSLSQGGSENDRGFAICNGISDGFVTVGSTRSFGQGSSDMWIIKTDPDPELEIALLSPAYGDSIEEFPTLFDWQDAPFQSSGTYTLRISADSLFNNPLLFENIEESTFSLTDSLEMYSWFFWDVIAYEEGTQDPIHSDFSLFYTYFDYGRWHLTEARAFDGDIPEPGIDDDDYVLLTFDRRTDKPEVSALNIDTVFELSNKHSWLDGLGQLGQFEWNTSGDKALVNLSVAAMPPTVAVGDTISPNYFEMSDSPAVITGSFSPPGSTPRETGITSFPKLAIGGVSPNPFNPVTRIDYHVPEKGRVRLVIHDLAGRQITVLVDGVQDTGNHSAELDASAMSSGVYFCRLGMPSQGAWVCKKIVLVK